MTISSGVCVFFLIGQIERAVAYLLKYTSTKCEDLGSPLYLQRKCLMGCEMQTAPAINFLKEGGAANRERCPQVEWVWRLEQRPSSMLPFIWCVTTQPPFFFFLSLRLFHELEIEARKALWYK